MCPLLIERETKRVSEMILANKKLFLKGEYNMKKLIALSAVALMASSAAIATVSLTGSASVTFDDNGTATNTTTGAASVTISGSNGGSSASASLNLLTGAMTGAEMSTTIGPVAVAATIDSVGTADVTLSLSVLAGDVTIALDQDGAATVSTTVAGVALSHTLGGDTSGSATLAGMDVAIVRTAAGATTWDVSTTLNGVTLSIDEAGVVTASMGLAGNTVTITNGGATTVSVSRDLTSGANLTAGYDTSDNSLSLVASVSF
jgi:hypothetical protein